jgi:hypothetical protein
MNDVNQTTDYKNILNDLDLEVFNSV